MESSFIQLRANYEVRIYSHEGVILRRVINIQELRLNLEYNSVSVCSVALHGEDAIWAARSLRPKEHVNYIISFYRDHPLTGTPTLLKSYFLQSFNPWFDENGTFYYHLGGISLESLLDWRLIVPEEDPRYDPQTVVRVVEAGVTSEVIAGLVENHLGALALSYRKIENMVTVKHSEIGEGGGEWDFDNLLEAVGILATSDSIDFKIDYNSEDHEFEFHIGEVYRDRRDGNLFGNTPFILAERLGNLREPNLTVNYQDSKNALYLHQEPEDETQRRLIIRMTSDTVDIPYNRREFELNNTRRDESETHSKLITEGKAELKDNEPDIELTIGLQDYLRHRFLIDWEFGDKLTVEFSNDKFNFQIRSLDISVSGEQEQIAAKLNEVGEVELETLGLLTALDDNDPWVFRITGDIMRLEGNILAYVPE